MRYRLQIFCSLPATAFLCHVPVYIRPLTGGLPWKHCTHMHALVCMQCMMNTLYSTCIIPSHTHTHTNTYTHTHKHTHTHTRALHIWVLGFLCIHWVAVPVKKPPRQWSSLRLTFWSPQADKPIHTHYPHVGFPPSAEPRREKQTANMAGSIRFFFALAYLPCFCAPMEASWLGGIFIVQLTYGSHRAISNFCHLTNLYSNLAPSGGKKIHCAPLPYEWMQ